MDEDFFPLAMKAASSLTLAIGHDVAPAEFFFIQFFFETESAAYEDSGRDEVLGKGGEVWNYNHWNVRVAVPSTSIFSRGPGRV